MMNRIRRGVWSRFGNVTCKRYFAVASFQSSHVARLSATQFTARQPQIRYFSNDSFPEKQFHSVCDETLELIQDELSDLESDMNEADISLSQGVLNINLGPTLGTWVINKQTPNRQIWWSSPISGPRRYEYQPDASGNQSLLAVWKYSKDGSSLQEALQKEMLKATGSKFFE